MATEAPTHLKFGNVILPLRAGLGPDDEPAIPAFDESYWLDEGRLEDIAVGVAEKMPVLLHGPTGCGKSTAVLQMAAMLGQPACRLNLHGDLRAADLLGEKTLAVDPASGQSVVVWSDGPVPRAMRRGWWLILDEFSAASAGINLTLQALLENGHRLTLAGNGGEVIDPHPDFRIFATDNTLGRGDETGLYVGTNALNEATLDRFCAVECGYPPAAEEEGVLAAKTGVDAGLAAKMVAAAVLVRQGFDKGECFATFSTRRLLAWAAFTMRYLPLGTSAGSGKYQKAAGRAYKLAVASKLGKEDAKYVAGVVQRVTGINV